MHDGDAVSIVTYGTQVREARAAAERLAADHRAQVLRVLNDLGVRTTYQDYIFYAFEHSINSG